MRQVNQLLRIVLKSTLVLLFLASLSLKEISAEAVDNISVAEQYLLAAANQERIARGLPKLQRDPVLARAAAYHARQMADHGDISHEFPGEPDLSIRGANAGVRFSRISENVAEAPDSVLIHDMWMHSEGHRANLLDPNVNVVGISVIVRDEQLYAVEDFARTVETLTVNQQESTVATLLARSGMNVASRPGATVDDATFKISLRPFGSSPAVGSSKIRYLGSIARTPAIATLLFWPPESSNGDESLYFSKSKPTSSIAFFTLLFSSSPVIPMFFGP